ncbi:MAG: hypothetical protein HHJ09_12790 [Glaciimonas sp.]|nr:hypothetical protein [Glaciimonas sp.]
MDIQVITLFNKRPFTEHFEKRLIRAFFCAYSGLMFHEQLNVNIQRYMSLRPVMQHRILKALDPVEYGKDINAAKRRKRRSRKLPRSHSGVQR